MTTTERINRRFVLSEKNIQNLLYEWAHKKGHKFIVPNCGAFGWEADLISFTQNDTGYEYEIKISVADFKADAKKKKHGVLCKKSKYSISSMPHYFYYVVPKNLIVVKDVPNHAGLIYVAKNNVVVVKKAPKLHKMNIGKRVIDYINRGLMLRYWSQRIKV